MLDADEGVLALADADQLVELRLKGRAVPVLGVLDQEHHEEGDDRRAGVDDQLPGVRKSNSGPRPQFDVDTLLDTAAAVSREIEVDGVVARVLRLAIENAGANRATLLLKRDGKLAVQAAATVSDRGTFDLQVPGPTEATPTRWPARVVDYVARTGVDLIVADASDRPTLRA